jgi:regulator of replication initiation timing
MRALTYERHRASDMARRANELGDQCGILRTENLTVLAENARLRRENEDLRRKLRR